jgi:hypothetical protein
MSSNQPTDQTVLSAKEKADAQAVAQLNAGSAGSLDRQALSVVKKQNAQGAGLHFVELTDDASKPPDSTAKVKPAETPGDAQSLGPWPTDPSVSPLLPCPRPDGAETGTPESANPAKTAADAFDSAMQKELEADAIAIRAATGNDNRFGRRPDTDGINKILGGKTDAERKAIDYYYKKDFKTDLDTEIGKFATKADLDKFTNILHRQDNDANNENARRIHEDLLERTNAIDRRSDFEIEKDIRDTLSSHNSHQIAQMNAEYKAAYGVTLNDALANDPTISQVTRDMANVYLNHTEQNADQETKQLIDIALKNENEECFAEVMKGASPTARKEFIDNGGENRLQETFSHWYSDADLNHAMDYAREGKLDAATQVEGNKHLFNNADGIELALKQMSDDERNMYQQGKSLSTGGKIENLSPEDAQKATAYYDKLHAAIVASGNATEVAKRECEIDTSNGECNLISNLASHRGRIWNDGEAKIDNDIRGMSQTDWNDCKSNPARRDELKTMLGSLNKSDEDINGTLAIYDKMINADSYATAKDKGQTSVLTKLDDSSHWFGGANRNDVIDSIAQMSQSEQDRYRTDATFRKQVDDQVASKIADPDGQDSVKRMLDCVKNGKPIDSDVIANLEKIQNLDGSKTVAAANTIDKAFHDDPTLKDRILHPHPDDDKFAQQFKTAVQNSFSDDYDNFGKPYVETGNLPIESKLMLAQGIVSNDSQQITNDLKNVTPEERERLISDPKYQEQVLGFLNADKQQIAMAVVSQGEERPEDKIRAATIGWGGSSEIISTLQDLSPADLDKAKVDYARKYGSSLEGDLTKKLSGKEREEAERVFTQNLSVESRVNISRDETENARSGFGAAVSDNLWRSGTGAQADNTMDQTVQALTEKNKEDLAIAKGSELAQNMTSEQQLAVQQKLVSNLEASIKIQQQATDNHAEAKAAAAEYVGDGVIAAAAIGSLYLTAGADAPAVLGLAIANGDSAAATSAISTIITTGVKAPLVVGLAVAGAGIKVGTKAALEGNNYDWSTKNVATDAAIGSVTGGTSVIAPVDIAAVFGVGKDAAVKAAAAVIAAVGANTLREGGQEALTTGATEIVRNALANGASTLDDKAFTALAERTIAPGIVGKAREQMVATLAKGMRVEVTNRMATGIVRTFTQQGLNMAGGAVGGGAGGAVQGTSQLDPSDSVCDNINKVINQTLAGSLSGAVGAGAMTAGMKGFGSGLKFTKGAFEHGPVAKLEVSNPAGKTLAGGGTDLVKTRDAITKEAPQVQQVQKPENQPDKFHKSVSEKFNQLSTPSRVQDAVESVKSDLKDVRGINASGEETSVLDSLTTDPTLSDTQKATILRNLAEVREHFASYRSGDRMHPDPEINWVHTQGELGRVMESARANKLTPNEMEDAMLASMYSDSVKFGFPAPEGASPNFFTHHLDGAIAADESLSKQGYPQDRIDSIVQAIKEHQVAPPKFMGKLYQGRLRQAIDTLHTSGKLSDAKLEEFNQTLKEMTSVEPNGNNVIHDIAYVNDAPKVQTADGNWEVAFTPKQKELLELAGIDKWSVPIDPTTTTDFNQLSSTEQAKLISNYKVASTLIDGDAIDNYATLGGASKIVALRKPGGGFVDDTIWKSVGTIDESYEDTYPLLSPGGKRLADATLANRNSALNDETTGIRAQMNAWLKAKGMDPAKDQIPYYNTKLKQPDPPTVDERKELTSGLSKDGSKLTQAQRDAITYKGLSPEEIQQFKNAQEMSLYMRELLLRASRRDNAMPGNFESAVKPTSQIASENNQRPLDNPSPEAAK